MLLQGDNSAELLATFESGGVHQGNIDIIPSSHDLRDLIRGEPDVFNTYISNELFLWRLSARY